MNKRILSLILALTMMFGMIPSFAIEVETKAENIDIGVSIIAFNEDGFYEVKHKPENKTMDTDDYDGEITALDLLKATAEEYDDSNGYITSINGIEGPSTGGWMFVVNGQIPSVGAGEAKIKDGDRIIWYCTYDYKRDEAPTWESLTGQADEKTSIKIKKAKDFLKVGEELSLEAEVKNGNQVLENREINWFSSDDEIVSIDENVKLLAHKVGQTDISASLLEDENIKDTIKVKIVKENKVQAKEKLDENLEKIYKEISNPTIGNEWLLLSLARGNYEVSSDYYNLYYTSLVEALKEDENKFKSATDYSKLILALTSMGKDVTDLAGYNLLDKFTDFEYVTGQGINGSTYSLLALDSHEYEIPTKERDNKNTRSKLIQDILDQEIDGGGWSWGFSSGADIDMTAMVIQALSPYYNKQNTVKTAIDRAVDWLSKEQADHGGFESWGSNSAETISQVIVALTDMGINPHKDERFIKDGNSPIDSLLTFEIEDVKSMTMEQSTYALVAYDRFLNNKTSLYDMSDVEINKDPSEPEEIFEEIDLKENENNPKIEIPEDDSANKKNYRIAVKAEDENKTINISIPEKNQSKLLLDLDLNTPLPEIQARKDKVSVNIPRYIELLSGKSSKVEILTSKDVQDRKLKNIIERNISRDYELDRVHEIIGMGGKERIEFSDYVTITFEGQASRDVGYIENNEFYTISKYGNDQSGRDSKKEEYAYRDGNDLIVKTKHFTDFLAYGSRYIGDRNDREVYVSLSIDKKTISKGYVLNSVDIRIRKGDLVWDIVRNEMDRRGIDYKASKDGYIQSIEGDGEFDHGPGSGWMFMVDGKYPDRGANQVKLYGGERIEWRYSKNLGEDLGEDLSKWERPSTPRPKKEIKEEITEIVLTKEKELKEVLSKEYKDTEDISTWALNDIQRATELGFIEGYNGEFNPKAHVTRAEFVKMIISLLNVDLEKIEGNNFTDVNESDWFYAYVNAAYEAGIVVGSEGKFNPNDSITREEMASITVRLLKLDHKKTDEKIKDMDNVSSWAKNDVESVVASGLLVGYENNFNPKDMATREMATAVLMRSYDYKNKE